MSAFAHCLIAWQKIHGRHDLPWQNTTDPYAIWVSEIMLQQTQVTAVIGYYSKFRNDLYRTICNTNCKWWYNLFMVKWLYYKFDNKTELAYDPILGKIYYSYSAAT